MFCVSTIARVDIRPRIGYVYPIWRLQIAESTELEYVGFWLRVWASVIDTVLMMMVIVPILFAIYGREQMASGVTLTGPANILISYLMPAVAVLAFWTAKRATPGKMIIGATIVDAKTGEPPSFKQHVIRYLGYFISTIPFCLVLIWVEFDKKKQGWHDKLAGTVVVRRKNRARYRSGLERNPYF